MSTRGRDPHEIEAVVTRKTPVYTVAARDEAGRPLLVQGITDVNLTGFKRWLKSEGYTFATYTDGTVRLCRSGHHDCTVDCGWCKGTGFERRAA